MLLYYRSAFLMTKASSQSVVPCLIQTWESSLSLLQQWLLKQCGDSELTNDLLQETFIRALNQKQNFCLINNQKAWLFRVAHNLLTDELRRSHKLSAEEDLLASLPYNTDELRPVDNLAQCLPKALNKLSAQEREIIESCDLRGLKQHDYATLHGLSLPATKSRIQRARSKLKQILHCQCQIKFDEHDKVCCFSPQHSKADTEKSNS